MRSRIIAVLATAVGVATVPLVKGLLLPLAPVIGA